MSSRHNAARQEAEQYDRASQPTSRPWDCEVHADLFGLNLLLEGKRFHIPYDRVDQVIDLLTTCERITRAPGEKLPFHDRAHLNMPPVDE
jgi:hypothetical protein